MNGKTTVLLYESQHIAGEILRSLRELNHAKNDQETDRLKIENERLKNRINSISKELQGKN